MRRPAIGNGGISPSYCTSRTLLIAATPDSRPVPGLLVGDPGAMALPHHPYRHGLRIQSATPRVSPDDLAPAAALLSRCARPASCSRQLSFSTPLAPPRFHSHGLDSGLSARPHRHAPGGEVRVSSIARTFAGAAAQGLAPAYHRGLSPGYLPRRPGVSVTVCRTSVGVRGSSGASAAAPPPWSQARRAAQALKC